MPDLQAWGGRRERAREWAFRRYGQLRPHARSIAIVAAVLALSSFVALERAWRTCGFRGCPDVAELAVRQVKGGSWLLDRNGEPLANLLPTEPRMVELRSLPSHVPAAFLAVEDRRFYKHAGVDWRRVLGAARANLRARGFEQGFSTVTMQLARNLFPERIPGRARTLGRKLLEVRVAREIERRFTKDEILELYLNHISFGHGLRGIEAAALYYFGRPARQLALEESALLAALPKAPANYDPRTRAEAARARRDLVLLLMERQERAAAALARQAREAPLGVTPQPPARARDPLGSGYFADTVRAQLEAALGDTLYDAPVRVRTTLDAAAQREALGALERQLRAIESGELGRFSGPRYEPGAADGVETACLQGALVMLDVRTGDVLAWVGGRDYGQSQFDRVARARRLAGSAFKPFVYAAALSRGFALSQPVEDVPLVVPLSDGAVWEPKNLGDSYDGIVSVRDALVLSKNVPTVRLAQSVGHATIAAFARRAGLRDLPRQPSLALGAGAVSPLELTAAYTVFAAAGRRVEPRLVTSVETLDGRVLWKSGPRTSPVLDPAVAFLVTEALRDALVRGSGARVRRAGFRGTAAGKTGTTNDGTDVWFVGYTAEVIAGVWIGFDEPRPITSNAIAGRLAAPVFGRLVASVAGGRDKARAFAVPRGVVARDVDPDTGLVLSDGCAPLWQEPYREFFLEGWEPAAYCPGAEDPPAHGFWTERDAAPAAPVLARGEAQAAPPGLTKASERPPP